MKEFPLEKLGLGVAAGEVDERKTLSSATMPGMAKIIETRTRRKPMNQEGFTQMTLRLRKSVYDAMEASRSDVSRNEWITRSIAASLGIDVSPAITATSAISATPAAPENVEPEDQPAAEQEPEEAEDEPTAPAELDVRYLEDGLLWELIAVDEGGLAKVRPYERFGGQRLLDQADWESRRRLGEPEPSVVAAMAAARRVLGGSQ